MFWCAERKNQGNCKTQGDTKVSHKRVENRKEEYAEDDRDQLNIFEVNRKA